MSANFSRGALLVRDEGGLHQRLSWGEREGGARGRERALAPGAYVVTGYRVLIEDDDGHDWHVSATDDKIAELKVTAGQRTRVTIEREIHVKKRRKGKQINFQVKGQGGAGLSIYKDGVRIPIGYRLLSASGDQLSAGKLRYG